MAQAPLPLPLGRLQEFHQGHVVAQEEVTDDPRTCMLVYMLFSFISTLFSLAWLWCVAIELSLVQVLRAPLALTTIGLVASGLFAAFVTEAQPA